jgi:hypothetical protein
MFRSYDHLQVEIYIYIYICVCVCVCVLISDICISTWRWSYHHLQVDIFPLEDGHKTETCSGYWIKYSNQCCVRRKPWTWPSTRNRMQTTNFKIYIYIQLKMVVQPKHVSDNLNKTVNNYWNRVALDENPRTWVNNKHLALFAATILPLRRGRKEGGDGWQQDSKKRWEMNM